MLRNQDIDQIQSWVKVFTKVHIGCVPDLFAIKYFFLEKSLAREVFVGTLATIYNVGDSSEVTIKNRMSRAAAVASQLLRYYTEEDRM